MIEIDPEEYSLSVFTDDELRAIEELYGPKFKESLLTPQPVEVDSGRITRDAS